MFQSEIQSFFPWGILTLLLVTVALWEIRYGLFGMTDGGQPILCGAHHDLQPGSPVQPGTYPCYYYQDDMQS
jgi:hypothetical protein